MISKKQLITFILSGIALLAIGCCDASQDAKTLQEEKIVMKTLDVKGMTCEGCEGTIINYLTKMDGVVSSKASHVKESVIIKYDESKTDIETIIKTITSTGYKVNGLKETTANN